MLYRRGGSSVKVYSACVSVLVEANSGKRPSIYSIEWRQRESNEVTYNSAIKALDASNEFVRAGMLNSSALMECTLTEKQIRPPHSSALVLDTVTWLCTCSSCAHLVKCPKADYSFQTLLLL